MRPFAAARRSKHLKSYKTWIVVGIAILLYFGIRAVYFRPGYTAGERAPDFTAVLKDGNSFALTELRGRYILVDFWGSWCGPCIRQKPEMQEIYDAFHTVVFTDASGFEIVSVAVEEDPVKWERALARLAPSWQVQVLDTVTSLRFFDGPVTKAFGVKRLPSSFLLDAGGHIVMTNPTLKSVRHFLEEKRRR